MTRGKKLLLTTMLLIPSIRVAGQVSADEAMQKLKERESAAAIRRLADLEREVALLRNEIEALKAERGPATAPVSVPLAAAPLAPAAPIAVRRETTAPVPQPLGELLSKLPKDARPTARTGWEKFPLADANQWLADNLKGKAVELEGAFTGAARIGYVKGADEGLAWHVALPAVLMPQEISGVRHRLSISGVDPFNFDCDEATARRWHAAIRSGQRVRVQGSISSIEVGLDKYTGHGSGWTLSLTVDGMKLVLENSAPKPTGK